MDDYAGATEDWHPLDDATRVLEPVLSPPWTVVPHKFGSLKKHLPKECENLKDAMEYIDNTDADYFQLIRGNRE